METEQLPELVDASPDDRAAFASMICLLFGSGVPVRRGDPETDARIPG